METVNKPKVSVCVVTYNHDRYIKDCLFSVLSQQYDVQLEILVGDDGSTDRTLEIIKSIIESYPGIIKLFSHEKNMGTAANYQFLIAKAQGNYIAHLDGDDYWMPGKLETQIDFLNKHPECVAVYSNAVVVSDNHELIGGFNNKLPEIFDLNFLLKKGNFLNHSTLLYHSKYKKNILEITENFIDYRIHIRLALHGNLGYLNDTLTVYRFKSATSVLISHNDLVIRLFFEALRDIDLKSIEKSSLISCISYFGIQIIFFSLRRGQFINAVRLGAIVIKELPKTTVLSFAKGLYYAVTQVGYLIVIGLPRLIYKQPLRVIFNR